MLAIIGGSGLTKLGSMEVTQRRVARTPYGEPSGALTFGRIRAAEVVFLARHGYGHTIAPHEVNYRANLWALKDAGADAVISVASVGAIRGAIAPGALVLPHQVIDYTWGRRSTYFEGPGAPVTHVDFTEPYSAPLRSRILKAAREASETVIDKGVYAATQGPRLETAAEIDRLERDGADLVGMTGMPEAVLAREISLEYAALAVVANYAAGRGESEHAVPLDRIGAVLEEAMGRVRRIIEKLCET
ncbi:MAG: methylthioadenosine phosphorylase [Betaproteobacteria bacterium RIFCSPLOWO2_12_FULL_68_19]|nr:MAG: methylthioadenosine phosphorylase [Betaproteobacteria bacterium RIFCSPLOWO2_12_FULL_68_19]